MIHFAPCRVVWHFSFIFFFFVKAEYLGECVVYNRNTFISPLSSREIGSQIGFEIVKIEQ